MIIDDDIRHLKEYRFQDGEFRHVRLEGDKLLEFIEWGFDLARQWGVRVWGVNSTFDKQSYREFQPFSTFSYVSASLHGFIDCPTRYDEALPLKEDFDLCLQEWNAHRAILRINYVAMVKDDHGNRGGCAAYGEAIDRGLTSCRRIVADTLGEDLDDLLDEIAEDEERLGELGLWIRRSRTRSRTRIWRSRAEGDADDVHRYTFRGSSDAPVEMWGRIFEILDHGEDAVRMDWPRFGNAPMLGMHKRYD